MRKWMVLFGILCLVAFLQAQEVAELPEPPVNELPEVFTLILGALSATIVEFVQKRKSKLASLGIAVGVSAVTGFLAALYQGLQFGDAALLIVQVWGASTAVWATLFKTAGLSKFLKTSAEG